MLCRYNTSTEQNRTCHVLMMCILDSLTHAFARKRKAHKSTHGVQNTYKIIYYITTRFHKQTIHTTAPHTMRVVIMILIAVAAILVHCTGGSLLLDEELRAKEVEGLAAHEESYSSSREDSKRDDESGSSPTIAYNNIEDLHGDVDLPQQEQQEQQQRSRGHTKTLYSEVSEEGQLTQNIMDEWDRRGGRDNEEQGSLSSSSSSSSSSASSSSLRERRRSYVRGGVAFVGTAALAYWIACLLDKNFGTKYCPNSHGGTEKTTYTCSDNTCQLSATGPYSTKLKCEANCSLPPPPPTGYTCSKDYTCQLATKGPYSTKSACEAKCSSPPPTPPPPFYNCNLVSKNKQCAAVVERAPHQCTFFAHKTIPRVWTQYS